MNPFWSWSDRLIEIRDYFPFVNGNLWHSRLIHFVSLPIHHDLSPSSRSSFPHSYRSGIFVDIFLLSLSFSLHQGEGASNSGSQQAQLTSVKQTVRQSTAWRKGHYFIVLEEWESKIRKEREMRIEFFIIFDWVMIGRTAACAGASSSYSLSLSLSLKRHLKGTRTLMTAKIVKLPISEPALTGDRRTMSETLRAAFHMCPPLMCSSLDNRFLHLNTNNSCRGHLCGSRGECRNRY